MLVSELNIVNGRVVTKDAQVEKWVEAAYYPNKGKGDKIKIDGRNYIIVSEKGMYAATKELGIAHTTDDLITELWDGIKKFIEPTDMTMDGGPGSGKKGHKTNKPATNKPATYGKSWRKDILILKYHLAKAKAEGDQEAIRDLQRALKERGSERSEGLKERGRKREDKVDAEKQKKRQLFKDSTSFTPEECQKVGEANGVDFSKYDIKQYCMGMNTEQEHNDLTNGDPSAISKIVCTHLNEIPDYYSRLALMENKAETKDWDFDQLSNQELRDAIEQAKKKGMTELVKKLEEVLASSETKDGGPGSGTKGHVTAKQMAAMKQRLFMNQEAMKRKQSSGSSKGSTNQQAALKAHLIKSSQGRTAPQLIREFKQNMEEAESRKDYGEVARFKRNISALQSKDSAIDSTGAFSAGELERLDQTLHGSLVDKNGLMKMRRIARRFSAMRNSHA